MANLFRISQSWQGESEINNASQRGKRSWETQWDGGRGWTGSRALNVCKVVKDHSLSTHHMGTSSHVCARKLSKMGKRWQKPVLRQWMLELWTRSKAWWCFALYASAMTASYTLAPFDISRTHFWGFSMQEGGHWVRCTAGSTMRRSS